MGTTFVCADCIKTLPKSKDGGTGYTERNGETICYDCCADSDRQEMQLGHRIALYWVDDNGRNNRVTNWPGTLSYPLRDIRDLNHAFAKGHIGYFLGPDGHEWSAKNIGESQIAHCRRLKRKLRPNMPDDYGFKPYPYTASESV